jgi:hypothetical protein
MITAIKSFGESIGKKWIKNKAMPILTEFIDHKDYLLRQNYTIGVVVRFLVLLNTENEKCDPGGPGQRDIEWDYEVPEGPHAQC